MTKEELLQIPFYIEDISGSANTVTIKKNNSSAPTLTLEYSTDGSTWATKTMNSTTTANTFELPANGKLYLRGVNNGWCGTSNNSYFQYIRCTGNHNVGGNSMSLLYGGEFEGKTSFPKTNGLVLSGLFYQNTTLVNAKDLILPSTILTSECYRGMFDRCSSLTTAPELPATTLANYCYTSMFYGCTSLTTAPSVLPATTLANYCYTSMFKDCSSLVKAPELPATTLADYCYSDMFANCSSLTAAPELPATTLDKKCYNSMFHGCSSLTAAPELPATTLAENCYNYMFNNCTNLTTAPSVLPAEYLPKGCYEYMFHGCSSLTTAPTLSSIYLDMYACGHMFYNCTSLTTAPELPAEYLAMDCYVNMFSGCSSLVKAPSILPAKDLAEYCYSGMFQRCTSLTTAPELPATTLAGGCYHMMFQGCSKLNYIKADFINYSNEDWEFVYWVNGVSSTGLFIMNPEANYNPEEIKGDDGIPTGWTVVTKTYTDTHVYIVNQSKNINTLIINNNGSDLQYLVDMTTEWVTLPTSKEPQRIEFQNGIALKGNNTSLNGCKIKTSNESTLNGNIMALLYGDDYENKVTFPEGSENTFKYLFLGYNKLTNISNLQLPATTLAPHCYQHMFTSCKSLKSIPKLPAIDLTNSCYHGMFMDCDGINKVTLPEAYLAPYAYSNMFLGSDNLSNVIVTYNENVDETNYKGWLKGVKTNGKFSYNNTGEVDNSIIKINYHVPGNWGINYIDSKNNYFYIEDISGSDTQIGIPLDYMTYSMYENGMLEQWEMLNLEYSYDKVDWNTIELNFDNGITWIDLPSNSKVYLRGNNKSWNAAIRNTELLQGINDCTYEDIVNDYVWDGYQQIVTLSECNVGGDILTLMYGEEIPDTIESKDLDCAFMCLFSGYEDWNGNWYDSYVVDASKLILPDVVGNSTYLSMFQDCFALITAPELPATKLYEYCYASMFGGCTSLVKAPSILPATTLAENCYNNMFYNCSGLTAAPELPATTVANYCYNYMFAYCTSLTTAPSVLPATTLAYGCYSCMFEGCSSLITAPELPATTLADYCYDCMFSGCSSLITAPSVLPAITLASECYAYMFEYCTSLTIAPELPATTLAENCYEYMFNNCTSLTIAPELPATTLANYCYYNMFAYCTSLTTAPSVLPATTLANNCYRDMFTYCSNLTTAPELPATTLAENCYQQMFLGCNSLTTAPELPATTLAENCYQQMFLGCNSLTTAPELPATTLANYCYTDMFTQCTSLTNIPSVLPATTMFNACYSSMFKYCSSLTTAPELPATTLAKECYYMMFEGCSSLTTAPELPATTLADYCYRQMFNDCRKLNYVCALFTTTPSTSYTYMWLRNVSSIGTFVMSSDATWNPESYRNYNAIPTGWTVTTK